MSTVIGIVVAVVVIGAAVAVYLKQRKANLESA